MYKAMRNGVQPVAVKVLGTVSSGTANVRQTQAGVAPVIASLVHAH